jgi:hypothetical protein
MKKLLLFLLLLPTLAWGGEPIEIARMNPYILGSGVSAAPACSTADSSIPHDVFIEGFQGTGYELAATYTFTETGSPDEDYDSTSLSTGKPTGACNEAYNVDTTGSEVYTILDLGAANVLALSSDLDIYFSFYFTASTDMYVDILFVDKTQVYGGGKVATVGLYKSGSTLQIRPTGSTSGTLTNITASAWHSCVLHLDSTAADSTLTCDGGSPIGFTRYTNSPDQVRGILFGGLGVSGSENLNIVFDLLAVDRP